MSTAVLLQPLIHRSSVCPTQTHRPRYVRHHGMCCRLSSTKTTKLVTLHYAVNKLNNCTIHTIEIRTCCTRAPLQSKQTHIYLFQWSDHSRHISDVMTTALDDHRHRIPDKYNREWFCSVLHPRSPSLFRLIVVIVLNVIYGGFLLVGECTAVPVMTTPRCCATFHIFFIFGCSFTIYLLKWTVIWHYYKPVQNWKSL